MDKTYNPQDIEQSLYKTGNKMATLNRLAKVTHTQL